MRLRDCIAVGELYACFFCGYMRGGEEGSDGEEVEEERGKEKKDFFASRRRRPTPPQALHLPMSFLRIKKAQY